MPEALLALVGALLVLLAVADAVITTLAAGQGGGPLTSARRPRVARRGSGRTTIMLLERLGASWTQFAAVLLCAVAVHLAVISLTRLAGVHNRAQVRAVSETTVDMSVLRTGEPWDDELLSGVRGRGHLR